MGPRHTDCSNPKQSRISVMLAKSAVSFPLEFEVMRASIIWKKYMIFFTSVSNHYGNVNSISQGKNARLRLRKRCNIKLYNRAFYIQFLLCKLGPILIKIMFLPFWFPLVFKLILPLPHLSIFWMGRRGVFVGLLKSLACSRGFLTK